MEEVQVSINQITIERKLKFLGECPLCEGITFNYDEVVISFELLTKEERERARELVKSGANLEKLLEEFDEIIYQEITFWECEKCGYSDSSPKYTTM